MDYFSPFVIVTLAVGLYVAWNIGANDVANAMGTSVGSRAITLKQAIIIAGVMEFLGATFFGKQVTDTIRKGIADPEKIIESSSYVSNVSSPPELIAIGALSAALAAGLWLTFASWRGLPVSTTQSIVGAMAGFGLGAGGAGVIDWGGMGRIVASWIISPIAGGIAAFLIFSLIRKFVLRKLEDERPRVERVFARFQLLTAAYVAFAHGSNDVANAVGPIAAALSYSQAGATLSSEVEVSTWLLAFGGIGIVIGLSTWGYKVMGTIGERVTEITPTRGFSAEFATASVVLANSYIGMPISTTHVLVGSVIGVGFARGIKALNFRIIGDIITSWVFTVPVTGILSIVIFKIIIVL
jgi:inorganic phosphate transporter, PiT family